MIWLPILVTIACAIPAARSLRSDDPYGLGLAMAALCAIPPLVVWLAWALIA